MKMHKISFPQEMYQLMQVKTGELGISVPEYVRHLIINDVETMPIEIATPEMEENIETGLRDIDEGKYIVIKNKQELKKFLTDL